MPCAFADASPHVYPLPFPHTSSRPFAHPVPPGIAGERPFGEIKYIERKSNGFATLSSLTVDATSRVSSGPVISELDPPLPDGTLFYSPDGNLLGYQGPNEGMIYDLQTREMIDPVKMPIFNRVFNWLPDSHKALVRTSNGELFLIDPINMEFIKLAVAAYGDFDGAAVSPDGMKVVYSIGGGLSQSGIWLIGADGRDAVKVQEASPLGYSFSWSPDGRQIAFIGNGLMILDADGTHLRTLSDFYIAQCYFLPPLWSPDSQLLAIVIDKGSEAFCQWGGDHIFETTNVLIINVDSGKSWTLLPDSEYGNIDPAWSPDGSRVAFVSNQSGNSEIWIVGIDGTDLHQLTNAKSYVRFPYWRKP